MAIASLLATLAAFGIVLATRDLGDFARSIFAVYAVAAALLAVTARWLVRFVPEAGRADDDRRRVLVVGAGATGRGYVRDLRRAGDRNVVGFLDDSPKLRRRRVLGVPVLGTTGDAATVLAATRADELVITIPDAPPQQLDAVERACESAAVGCSVVRETASPSQAPPRAIPE
jgi:FlaA1/EpsC-like NDP-sugar epimerase